MSTSSGLVTEMRGPRASAVRQSARPHNNRHPRSRAASLRRPHPSSSQHDEVLARVRPRPGADFYPLALARIVGVALDRVEGVLVDVGDDAGVSPVSVDAPDQKDASRADLRYG